MIDFSKITSMVIPEGNVIKIEVDGVIVAQLGNRYTITYNANGGSGSMASQTVNGTSASVGTSTFTRTGYNFTGWNTKADGSGTSYSNGQAITLTGNITLYAQWSIKMFTLTYNAKRGDTIEQSGTGPQEYYALWVNGTEYPDFGDLSGSAKTYSLPYGTRVGVVAQVKLGDGRSYVSWNGSTVAGKSSSAAYEFDLTSNTKVEFEWNQWFSTSSFSTQDYWNCYITTS